MHEKAQKALSSWLAIMGDVIGRGPAEHFAVTGEVPNLAARIQTVASVDTIMIADATKKLLRNRFECSDAGLYRLKGIGRDIRLWTVARECDDFSSASTYQSDNFVGRELETAFLHDEWAKARAGDGRTVVLSGEAGIGKSTLLAHWRSQLADDDFFPVTMQCSARHRDTAFYPLIGHLRRAAALTHADSTDEQLDKIEQRLAIGDLREKTPLLAALLSIAYTQRYPPLALAADRQRALTLNLLANQIVALSRQKPVLLLVEDAHWMDPSTEELANQLANLIKNNRVLAIVACRPEYQPDWINLPKVSRLTLSRLEQVNAEQLVRSVVGRKRLPGEMVEQILEKTDGIPLFIEELTKTVLESGLLRETESEYILDSPLPALSIPSTLQDSLMARLDRLGATKNIAQIGAAIGRNFSLGMIAAITARELHDVSRALDRLTRAELISKKGEFPDIEYAFKHALVQDAAYATLLREKRKALHGQIATVFERQFTQAFESEPEAFALHWTRSEMPEKAAPYWLKAAQRSVAKSANVEAIRHAKNGLDAIGQIEGPERGLLEFNLSLSLGQASYVANGPAHDQTIQAFLRAQELVEEVADAEQRYMLLYGIFSGYHFASRFDLAEPPARRAWSLAKRDNDPGHLCQAHRMLGYLDFFRGNTRGAVEHFSALARIYDPNIHGTLAARYGADSLVAARGFHIVVEGVSGRIDSALKMAAQNLVYAKRLGHPATIGWAFASLGYFYFFIKEPAEAAAITAEGASFCDDNRVAVWGGHCKVFNAWGRATAGTTSPLECLTLIQQANADAGTRIALGLPLFRGALAETLVAAGRIDDALAQTASPLAEIASTGQDIFEPSIQEIRGRCLRLQGSNISNAEKCFRKSAVSANRMEAKLLELRALTAIANLHANDPRFSECRERVSDLYSQVTEGLDRVDMASARTLLMDSERSPA
jgi:tetratricopeptide (TPR) repeat protein